MKNRVSVNLPFAIVFFVMLWLIFPVPHLRASGKTEQQAGAETQTGEKDEYPQWVRDLRRADIITFGVFPFTFFLASTIVETYRFSQHDWDSRYAPWPVGSVSRTTGEHIAAISVAAGGAVLVAVADYFIQRAKRERAAQAAARIAPSEPVITRTPWPPGEEAEDGQMEETPLSGIGGEPPGEAP
ncbi:MAG: hypothetical protein LBE17_11460 [Treponema sp.]|jgi:hypothetical protein|nr:hypothetical protein [Treponema sp.]